MLSWDRIKNNFSFKGAIKLVRYIFNKMQAPYLDYKSNAMIVKLKSKKHYLGESIKVGFIAQFPSCWDKQEMVFESMLGDSRFDVFLLCPPEFDFQKTKLSASRSYIDYYRKKYPNTLCVDLRDITQKKIEILQSMDYVFYDRPYNIYLPEILHGKNIARNSKICSIPYCSKIHEDSDFAVANEEFMRYTYILFCSEKSQVVSIGSFKYLRRLKGRKYVSLGYPVYERYSGIRKCNNLQPTVLWTPRWSTDPKWGGSHFFEYKDRMIEMADKYPIQLIIRPHPLMWSNFIRLGIMSREKIAEYKNTLAEHGIILDQNELIETTFDKTDILITDMSTIIDTFFCTARPIILCDFEGVRYSSRFMKIKEAIYSADSFDEIETITSELISGTDPKRNERKILRDQMIKQDNNACSRIVEFICGDFYS